MKTNFKNLVLFNAVLIALSGSSCSGSDEDSQHLIHNSSRSIFPISKDIESIPLPPAGKRWIVNETFSDEFNDTELNKDKWFDYHPNWRGREPGLFESKNVSLKDGYLVLEGSKMEEDRVISTASEGDLTFNISCAAVISKTQKAHYGYYECCFKSNKTTLSTTFWMSSHGNDGLYDTEGRQPEGSVKGLFTQELDICETIGRSGDFGGSFFADGMISNVHYWLAEGGEFPKQDIRVEETRLYREDGRKPSDDFNVYGCWWRDEENVSFYLNNGQETHRNFVGHKNWNEPYDINFKLTEPMSINLVVETYPYPWVSLPTDEELADPTKNKSYYDWVRAYILVDAQESNLYSANSMDMFDTHINFESKPEYLDVKSDRVDLNISYTTSKKKRVEVVIYNSKKEVLAETEVQAHAGYANVMVTVDLDSNSVNEKDMYYVVAYIGEGDNLSKTYIECDSFGFQVE